MSPAQPVQCVVSMWRVVFSLEGNYRVFLWISQRGFPLVIEGLLDNHYHGAMPRFIRLTTRLLITLSALLLTIPLASAQSYTVDGTVEIYLATPALTFQLRGGSGSNLVVRDNSFTVTTTGSDTVTVSSFTGLALENDGDLEVGCYLTETRVIVPKSRSVTFTPTGAVLCTGSAGSSPGGSSGASSGGSSGASAPSSIQNATPVQPAPADTPAVEEKQPEEDENKLAGFVDIDDLLLRDQSRILSLIAIMERKNTYAQPSHGRFGPRTITTAGFTAQIMNALRPDGCGDGTRYRGVLNCFREARAEGYVQEDALIRSRVTRADYYEVLIKAVGLQLEKGTVEDLRTACADVSNPTEELAQIYFTARKYEIASDYGDNCRLDLFFPRYEAVRFTMRALGARQ